MGRPLPRSWQRSPSLMLRPASAGAKGEAPRGHGKAKVRCSTVRRARKSGRARASAAKAEAKAKPHKAARLAKSGGRPAHAAKASAVPLGNAKAVRPKGTAARSSPNARAVRLKGAAERSNPKTGRRTSASPAASAPRKRLRQTGQLRTGATKAPDAKASGTLKAKRTSSVNRTPPALQRAE